MCGVTSFIIKSKKKVWIKPNLYAHVDVIDVMSFHRTTTSLKHHLRLKHIYADVSKDTRAERGSTN